MMRILLVFAQLEREQTAERTRDAIRARAERGLWVGGRTPLGYYRDPKTSALAVVEEEAKIVRTIFDRYVAIGSAPRVAPELNEAGMRQRSGKAFRTGSVLHVVSNRIYLGEIPHLDEYTAGRHEPLVDADLFARAQAALVANRTRAAPDLQHEYLLTGLAFDSAGMAFTPQPSTSRTGRRYPYYESSGKSKRVDHECEVTRVRAGELEAAVLVIVREAATEPALVDESVAEANALAMQHADPIRGRAEALRVELAKVRRDADRSLDSILAAGLDARPTAKRCLADLEHRQAQLEVAVVEAARELEAAEDRIVDPLAVRAALESFTTTWQNLTIAERREVLQLMIHRVEVRRDHLVIELYDGRSAQVALHTSKKASPRPSSIDEPGVRFRSPLAPKEGLEPPTRRLTAACSTD